MAREAINWRDLDPMLRRMARAGFSIKRQARKLNVSERAVYQRRNALGIGRKKNCAQENSSHVAS